MNINIKQKLIALALASEVVLTACGAEMATADPVYGSIFEPIEDPNMIEKTTEEEPVEKEVVEKEQIQKLAESIEESFGTTTTIEEVEELEEPKQLTLNDVKYEDVVKSNAQVNIRTMPDKESESVGILPKNDVLPYVGEEGDWYVVHKDGYNYYISKEFSEVIKIQTIEGTVKKVIMFTEETVIETTDDHIILPKYECAEIYEDLSDKYLVKTNDYIGYISKENFEELTGRYAIVDISNQEIRIYKDNELLYIAPVVTGKNNATRIGSFRIFEATAPKILVGTDYRSPVDFMLKFDGNIGLHDAEYHSCENYSSHGWRNISEFGGETYKKSGSHGCINMPHAAAEFAYDNLTIDDRVIVKQ